MLGAAYLSDMRISSRIAKVVALAAAASLCADFSLTGATSPMLTASA
jgi:hypothetical protein